ncbi:MAG: glycosyl hydrolase, partial [Bacteroidota bacterium]
EEAMMFDIKDALWYMPRMRVSSQGSAKYVAKNPAFGATFTYYLKDGLKTREQVRKAAEKELAEAGDPLTFPGWEALEAEKRAQAPQIMLIIKDEAGEVVNRIKGKNAAGINRVSWNLRYASQSGIELDQKSNEGPFGGSGLRATPGTYTVTLASIVDGKMTPLTAPKSFEVKPLRKGALPGASVEELTAFREELQEFQQDMTATTTTLKTGMKQIKAMYTALGRTTKDDPSLMPRLYEAHQQLLDLEKQMNGDPTKQEVGEPSAPTPRGRISLGFRALRSTYGPTPMHRESVAIGKKQLQDIKTELAVIIDETLPALEADLVKAGAPWMEGQGLLGE